MMERGREGLDTARGRGKGEGLNLTSSISVAGQTVLHRLSVAGSVASLVNDCDVTNTPFDVASNLS